MKPEAGDHESATNDDAQEYPSTKVLLPVVLSVCLASFLASLVSQKIDHPCSCSSSNTSMQDRTIIGVAVPAISNDFGSFNDISWYESGYLLTFAALQLPMGKIYVRAFCCCRGAYTN